MNKKLFEVEQICRRKTERAREIEVSSLRLGKGEEAYKQKCSRRCFSKIKVFEKI